VTSRARKEEYRKIRAEAYARLIGAASAPRSLRDVNEWMQSPDVRRATGEIMPIGSDEVKLRLGHAHSLFREF
jgi:hypothetical protein